MDSSSLEDNQSLIAQLNDQLTTYQALNLDLSKKVQELKIYINSLDKEIVAIRKELISEQLKTSGLRQALNMMNGHCTNFFNKYVANLKTCLQRTNLDMTLPGQDPVASTVNHKFAIACKPPSKIQGHVTIDPNRDNLLLTINEESQVELDNTVLPVTSTPLIVAGRQPLRERQNIPEINIHDTTGGSNFKTPMRPRISLPKFNESIPEESEVVQEASEVSQESQATPDKSQMSEVLQTSELAETTEVQETVDDVELASEVAPVMEEKNHEVAPETDEDQEVASETDEEEDQETLFQRFSIKQLSVKLTKVKVSKEDLKAYVANFHEEELNMSGASTTSSAVSTRSTKRRKSFTLVTVAPRRSSGRPKRKARAKPGTLKESSLRKKLRRS